MTNRQLEALQLYLRVALGEMRYREAAFIASERRTKGSPKPLTIGSFFRTVQQARKNVKESVATLIIGIWLGIVKPDDVRRLLDALGGSPRDLSDEQETQVANVLRVLIQKIVM